MKQLKNLNLSNLCITKFRRNWLHLLKKKKSFSKNTENKNQGKKELIDIQKKDKVEDIPKEEKEDEKDNSSKIEINEKKEELKEDEKVVEKNVDTKKRRKRRNK